MSQPETAQATSQQADEARLLKAAVTSLDKKLRSAQDTITGLQQETVRLRQDAADLPGVRARLAEQLASCRQAEAAAGQLRRELAQAQAAAEEAKSQRDAARAAAQQAAADAEEQRTAVAAWRTDVEAASLQVARAVGRAELLEAQVQQLEGANAGLRMDNQAHAARLKAAYEREGELLAEVAEMQARLRQAGGQQHAPALPAPTASPPVPEQAPRPASPLFGLEQAQHDLFVAATRQLMQEADCRAAQLEAQLGAATAAVAALRAEAGQQAASLAAAQERCEREAAAAQGLLDTNLRLHEAVAQLMEQQQAVLASAGGQGGQGCCGAADAAAGPEPAAEHSLRRPAQARVQTGSRCQLRPVPQRQEQRPAKGGPAKVAQPAAARPRAASSDAQEAGGHMQPAGRPSPRWGRAPATALSQLARQPLAAAQSRQDTEAEEQPGAAAAREAAVEAALALAAEHRDLLARHKAACAELQRVAGSLAGAPPSKQLALLRRRAELQEEVGGVASQLEDCVAQLAALRGAGLL